MDNFLVENLGPIAKAEVDFGDLTILTGPQATGKTLFLETFKLAKDFPFVEEYYINSNHISDDVIPDDNAFLDFYYGDQMHHVITANTYPYLNDKIVSLSVLGRKIYDEFDRMIDMLATPDKNPEIVLFIPAQRSLALSEGRIKLSDDFINSPFVLIRFCNYLQKYAKYHSEHILSDTIKNFEFLENADINFRRRAGSPRLEMTIRRQTIPYMAWSTGQREITPLLMALDYLRPKSDYIVIEEPELGLHPRAIIEFMLTVLKIMQTGTKVIISTHSSTPLDFVWTIKHLKEKGAKPTELAKMFDFKIKDKTVFDNLFDKIFKTYYFAPDKKTKKVYTKDISSLDVYSEDEDVSNWGGMSLSADRAGSIVSKF